MGHNTDAILEAIQPAEESVTAQKLIYPNLRSALREFGFLSFVRRGGEMIVGKRKIPNVATIQHNVEVAYMLNASYRLQRSKTSIEKFFWAQHFSASSARMFGRPVSKDVAALAASELELFRNVANMLGPNTSFALPLLESYALLTSRSRTIKPPEAYFEQTMTDIRAYVLDQYAEVMQIFDAYDDQPTMSATELYESFSAALKVLARQDPAWEKWQVVYTKAASLSINVRRAHISIGRRRVPISSHDVRGLFAHEVLVHAQRSVNGKKISRELSFGLPDYLTAEEGLGVLVEASLNGEIPFKVKDHYIDIALALGSYRRRALTRHELFEIGFIRAVLRSMAHDSPASLDELEQGTWEHVNRIYRGTPGNRYIGVFTKDIAYYEGFVHMAKFISRKSKKYPIDAVMTYVLSAKFDPMKKAHTNRVGVLTK